MGAVVRVEEMKDAARVVARAVELEEIKVVRVEAVSYTHQTLPTKRIV